MRLAVRWDILCLFVLIILGTFFAYLIASQSDTESEYQAVASQINELEIRELIAKGKGNDAEAADVSKRLVPFKERLSQLRREQQREEEEKQERLMQKMNKAAAELQKQCEAVRSKRVVDLTVNDLELLKQCGTPLPHFPQVP